MGPLNNPLGHNLTQENDPLINSPFDTSFSESFLSPPPPFGFFLWLDNTIFTLLDGEDLTLL